MFFARLMKKLPPHLETDRLLLRPLEPGDLDFFVRLHQDRDVVRYLGDGGEPRSPEATEAWLAEMVRWYEEHALGPYAIVLRSAGRQGELVGRTGLTIFEIERTAPAGDGIPIATWGVGSAREGVEVESLLEIGYVVHPSAQGRGIATEASSRWQRFAFEIWEEPVLHSVIASANTASLKVAARNGLESEGRSVRMDGQVYGLYRRDRSRWLEHLESGIREPFAG